MTEQAVHGVEWAGDEWMGNRGFALLIYTTNTWVLAGEYNLLRGS